MAAGLADHVWTMEAVADLLDRAAATGGYTRLMRSTVGFGVIICIGVILLPLALLFLLYIPALGGLLGVLSLAALLTGSIGVVGGWR
jgi:hypothetical protein